MRFACIHRLKPAEAQKILEKDLAYTLHRPRRRGRFPTLPLLVFGKDEQWVADLVECNLYPNIIEEIVIFW